jgi:uncharacterized pyridoxal phosphate-containing UPF0001 family protein
MTIVSGLRIIDSNAQTGITWWNWTNNHQNAIFRQLDNFCLDALSMGMSHDLELAVQNGATFVRVGRSLCG